VAYLISFTKSSAAVSSNLGIVSLFKGATFVFEQMREVVALVEGVRTTMYMTAAIAN